LKNLDLFPQLLKNNPELVGLNVTIPYKEEILKYADKLDESAAKVGAANTLKIQNGKITAYNTDTYGFEQSFIRKRKKHHKKALILGTGGASKAVAFVLQKLSVPFLFVSRNPKQNNQISYAGLNKKIITEHQIIINTTPLGTYPDIHTYPDIPYEFAGKEHYFFDLVYNPEKSLFLQKAERQGAVISNGLTMLKLQAEKAWEIWTDKN